MLFDAHNHLQDERLIHRLEPVLTACSKEDIGRMVVNGSCEADWPQVLELARNHPIVLPSFGYHPWNVRERTPRWREMLLHHLDSVPSAIGEIGLDRWINDPDIEAQEETFRWQLRLAAERDLPVTIHCLRAWGRLNEILREEPRPARGFLLHSYGGPVEMVDGFVDLGAFFSISGYFAHERKTRQCETFKRVPADRLLIETDAPDMWPPDPWNRHPLLDETTGKPSNHPANLGAVYDFTAEVRELERAELVRLIEQNFQRLFGNIGTPLRSR